MSDNSPQLGGQHADPRTGNEPELSGARRVCCGKPIRLVDIRVNRKPYTAQFCDECHLLTPPAEALPDIKAGFMIVYPTRV